MLIVTLSGQQLLECLSLSDRLWNLGDCEFCFFPSGRNSLSGVNTAEIIQARKLFIEKCSPRQVEKCGKSVVFSE